MFIIIFPGDVIAGLELAISSMKVGELSKFLVTPEYGYGKFGCPPRIPGSAMCKLRHVSQICPGDPQTPHLSTKFLVKNYHRNSLYDVLTLPSQLI